MHEIYGDHEENDEVVMCIKRVIGGENQEKNSK